MRYLLIFASVALAELADKTQISLMLLSAESRNRLSFFLGSVAAFAVVDGVSIFLGACIAKYIPAEALKIVASAVFILFGIIILKNGNAHETSKKYPSRSPFIAGFLVILLMEIGDKTQILTATLAATYNPVGVFVMSMLALSSVALLSVFIGKIIVKLLPPRTISITAGVVFLLMGISFMFA